MTSLNPHEPSRLTLRTKFWYLFQAIQVLVAREGPMVRIRLPPAASQQRTRFGHCQIEAFWSEYVGADHRQGRVGSGHCLTKPRHLTLHLFQRCRWQVDEQSDILEQGELPLF